MNKLFARDAHNRYYHRSLMEMTFYGEKKAEISQFPEIF
jgi:hypothetical protein